MHTLLASRPNVIALGLNGALGLVNVSRSDCFLMFQENTSDF